MLVSQGLSRPLIQFKSRRLILSLIIKHQNINTLFSCARRKGLHIFERLKWMLCIKTNEKKNNTKVELFWFKNQKKYMYKDGSSNPHHIMLLYLFMINLNIEKKESPWMFWLKKKTTTKENTHVCLLTIDGNLHENLIRGCAMWNKLS